MLKIKVSICGAARDLSIAQFGGTELNVIDGCRFYVNSTVSDADFWFVIEDANSYDREAAVPGGRVYFASAEVAWPPGYYAENESRMTYLRQFSRIFTCHDIFLDSVTYTTPFLPWMVNANHGPSIFATHARDAEALGQIVEMDKPKTLSVFCSLQDMNPTHRLRLRFVEQLKKHFGDKLDWYGNGVRPLPEKWEGIAPYRYHLVLENQSAPNVITEKLYDSFLCLAYPIYWGAPNVDDFFDPRSYSAVDIKDLQGSIARIEALIGSNTAEDRRKFLLGSRSMVLNKYNLFRRMARIAHEDRRVHEVLRREVVALDPFPSSALPVDGVSLKGWRRTVDYAGRASNRVGRRLEAVARGE